MAGRIGACRVRRIRNDRIAAGGGDQRHLRHVVHGELAARLALRDALGEQARRHPMRERHAVADEKDDVLRLARAGIVDVPRQLADLVAIGHAHLVGAGLRERNIAQDQGGLVLAVLAFDESSGLVQNLGVIVAVQRHGDLRRVGQTRKLDFEVEPRARQDIRPIDRIDGLRRSRRNNRRNRDARSRREKTAHVVSSQKIRVARPSQRR